MVTNLTRVNGNSRRRAGEGESEGGTVGGAWMRVTSLRRVPGRNPTPGERGSQAEDALISVSVK